MVTDTSQKPDQYRPIKNDVPFGPERKRKKRGGRGIDELVGDEQGSGSEAIERRGEGSYEREKERERKKGKKTVEVVLPLSTPVLTIKLGGIPREVNIPKQ